MRVSDNRCVWANCTIILDAKEHYRSIPCPLEGSQWRNLGNPDDGGSCTKWPDEL
jgi:hypothetical protein